jgi:DNA-binding transcriptional ArsR family regulator
LKIMRLLAESPGPLCVNAITHRLGVSQSAVSRHLRVLRQTSLATGERYGFNVNNSLNTKALGQCREDHHDSFCSNPVLGMYTEATATVNTVSTVRPPLAFLRGGRRVGK